MYDDNKNLVNGSSTEAPPTTVETAETYYANWWEWNSSKIGGPYTTTVVDNVEWSIDAGQTLTDLTGQFYGRYDLSTLGSYNINVLPGGVTPAEAGIADEEISVKVIYQYDPSSVTVSGTSVTNTYGHYTIANAGTNATNWNNIVGSIGNVVFNSTVVGDGKYTLSTNAVFTEGVAGRYVPTSTTADKADALQITITRGSVSKTYTSAIVTNAPDFEIYYNKPELKWTNVAKNSRGSHRRGYSNSISEDGYTLNAYFTRYETGSIWNGTYSMTDYPSNATLGYVNLNEFGTNVDSIVWSDVTTDIRDSTNITITLTSSSLTANNEWVSAPTAMGTAGSVVLGISGAGYLGGDNEYETIQVTKGGITYKVVLKSKLYVNAPSY